jgi:hypothetical protein
VPRIFVLEIQKDQSARTKIVLFLKGFNFKYLHFSDHMSYQIVTWHRCSQTFFCFICQLLHHKTLCTYRKDHNMGSTNLMLNFWINEMKKKKVNANSPRTIKVAWLMYCYNWSSSFWKKDWNVTNSQTTMDAESGSLNSSPLVCWSVHGSWYLDSPFTFLHVNYWY